MKFKGHETNDQVMAWDDSFRFRCHPGVACFNNCCRDVTILLNPLDVPRMRAALGIASSEFLAKYTVRLVSEATGVPAVALKMNEDEHKRCPFVTEAGCSIYDSRPYSCRMYPLDTEQGVEYRFIVGPDTCFGLNDAREWTVEEWLLSQDLRSYDDMDHQLKDVMHAELVWEAPIKDKRMQDMIYMALYDPDRFRAFVFESSFLKKFKIDDDILEKIRDDDVSLLYFAAQWLRFALFGKKGFLKLDKDYLDAKKKEVLNLGSEKS
jgi:Fe-S-cluster containining protein